MISNLFRFLMHLRTFVLLIAYTPITMLNASVFHALVYDPLQQHNGSSSPPCAQELDVNIDFDDASYHWRKNKQSLGNGEFSYIDMPPDSALSVLPLTSPQHHYNLRSRKQKREERGLIEPAINTPELSPIYNSHEDDQGPCNAPVKRRRYNLRSSTKM